MGEIVKIFKNIGIVGIIILSLSGLGYLINNLIGSGWNYLTNFFSFIKKISLLIDFTWATDTMWLLVGIGMAIEVAYISYEATIFVINKFKH